jgi:ankyrin repeat protein
MMRGRFDEMSKMSSEADDSDVYGEGRAGEMYQRMLCGLDTLEDYPNRRKVLLKIARYYRQRGDEPEVLKTLERVVHPELSSSTSADPDVWRMFSESIVKTTSSDTCASPYLNESTLPNNSCPIFHRSLRYQNHFVSQNFRPPDAATVPPLDIIRRHPIHAATDCGDAETVKHLIKVYPKAIDARDSFERTPIFVAASRGHEEVFEVLQRVGASLEVRNVLGHSIMQVAAQGGHVRIVGRLLQLGCSVNEQTLRTHGAYPPLHAAAGAGRFDVVYLLVRNNADITQKDICLRTPEQFAREQGHDQLAAFLAEEAISNPRHSGLV